jgi:hypothetical protein
MKYYHPVPDGLSANGGKEGSVSLAHAFTDKPLATSDQLGDPEPSEEFSDELALAQLFTDTSYVRPLAKPCSTGRRFWQ